MQSDDLITQPPPKKNPNENLKKPPHEGKDLTRGTESDRVKYTEVTRRDREQVRTYTGGSHETVTHWRGKYTQRKQ